jgi:DNA primase large subunit
MFADEFERDITKFEQWMLSRTVRKVRKLVKRDELLRKAMEIVINKPEEGAYRYQAQGRYALSNALGTTGMTAQTLQESAEKIKRAQMAQQMMNSTWTDPRIAQQRLHDNY